MLISAVDHPMEIKDLTSKVLDAKMEIVTAAREAHLAGQAADALTTASKSAGVAALASNMAGAAKAAEFTARKIGCRLHMPVDASPPHLPMMAQVGVEGLLLMSTARLELIRKFI